MFSLASDWNRQLTLFSIRHAWRFHTALKVSTSSSAPLTQAVVGKPNSSPPGTPSHFGPPIQPLFLSPTRFSSNCTPRSLVSERCAPRLASRFFLTYLQMRTALGRTWASQGTTTSPSLTTKTSQIATRRAIRAPPRITPGPGALVAFHSRNTTSRCSAVARPARRISITAS